MFLEREQLTEQVKSHGKPPPIQHETLQSVRNDVDMVDRTLKIMQLAAPSLAPDEEISEAVWEQALGSPVKKRAAR